MTRSTLWEQPAYLFCNPLGTVGDVDGDGDKFLTVGVVAYHVDGKWLSGNRPGDQDTLALGVLFHDDAVEDGVQYFLDPQPFFVRFAKRVLGYPQAFPLFEQVLGIGDVHGQSPYTEWDA